MTDWQYCQLGNCRLSDNTVILSADATGTLISEIRDSSERIHHYDEIIQKINVPLSTSALLYVRSGWNSEYYADSWTDWKLINEPEQRMEYTLSLTKNKIIVDYDIQSILNIYCVNTSEYQALAMNLSTIYSNALTNADSENPIYSFLWSGLTDEAITDFAKTDQDGEPKTPYATNATFVNNAITLETPLPSDNSIVIVKYIPRHFVYSDANGRYIQFKIELLPMETIFFQDSANNDFLTSTGDSFSVGHLDPVSLLQTHDNLDFVTADGDYFNVHSINPIVSSITINYHLDFQTELEDIFPKFFRRL
jgi:hypothetical protein